MREDWPTLSHGFEIGVLAFDRYHTGHYTSTDESSEHLLILDISY
jgi:hypothetical protein